MASAWGSALESLGRSLPSVGASFDDYRRTEEENKRKKEMEDLRKREALAQLSEIEDAAIKRGEADKNLNRYQSDMAALSGLNKELGADPARPEIQGKMGKLSAIAGMKPIERMGNYNLISGSAYHPGAKAILDTELQTQKGAGGTSGGAVWSQKKALFDSDPDAMAKLSNQIDNFAKSNLLSEQSAAYFKNRMTTDPISTSILLDEYVSKPEISSKVIEAQTAPKVQQKYALVAPEATTAAATAAAAQEAKVAAPKSLEQKESEFITNTRSAYDDISYARSKFDPKFATPYFGRVVKISTMKQLSPEFNDFIGSLERGLGTYRRENFGTAQTGTELQNLKDIVDKDMAVDPKVLVTQIDKFLKTSERDYNDKIRFLKGKGQNKVIPEGYEEIGVKGGMAEGAQKKRKVWNEATGKFEIK